MRPIINDCVLRTPFSRNRGQRKNETEVDSTVRVPCPVHNEALGVQVPGVKHRKTKCATDGIAFNIGKALLERSPRRILVTMVDLHVVHAILQRSRLEKLALTQDEIRYPLIMKLRRILHLPAHKVSLFCEMRAQLVSQQD